MSLAHWERCVIDNTLRMMAALSPEARAEAMALLNGEPVQSPLDPGASPDTLPINQGPTPPPVKKPRDRSTVTLIRRVHGRIVGDEPELDDRGLTMGGRDPREFWDEPDPFPKAKRDTMKARKMGRPI